MLARFDERAPTYDRENRFFDEDFEELRASGYLLVAVPTEFGGAGARPRRVRRSSPGGSAYVAPATALAVNMHVLLDRRRRRPAAQRRRLVPLHPRAGRRRRDVRARSTARPATTCRCCSRARAPTGSTAAGRSAGHKIFGSLSPVWTLGGFHAMDTSDPAAPQIVHGFLPRDTDGIQIIETWDTLGMRATQSQDTVLDKAFVPDELVALVCPAGLRRRRPVPGVDLRLGADGLRVHLPRRGQAGVRHHGRADAEAHVDRA